MGDRMELRQLAAFLKVAELLNFTKAAEQLGYTQSAVTLQIRQLERELGGQLFDRIGKTVSLTDRGQQFLPHAYQILKEVENSKNELRREESFTGTIVLGTMHSLSEVFLPEAFWEFHKRFPKMTISVRTGPAAQLVDMVMTNEVDLVFFLDEGLYGKRCGYSFEFLHRANFACSPHHYLSRLPSVTVDDLAKQSFILTEENINYRRLMEESLLRLQGKVNIRPYLEVENTTMIRRMVEEGMGISLLPDFFIQEDVKAGKLAVLPVENLEVLMYSQLIYYRNKWLSPALTAMIDILQHTVSKKLQRLGLPV